MIRWRITPFFILGIILFLFSCKSLPSFLSESIFPPSFDSLAPHVKEYLKEIHTAFKEHHEEILFAQGEVNYEKEMRKKVSSDQYFALLYRIGQYSKDSTWELPPFKFKLEDVKTIKFIDYVEQGPVTNVNIMIVLNKSGEPIPARLSILTRLKILKIIGTYP